MLRDLVLAANGVVLGINFMLAALGKTNLPVLTGLGMAISIATILFMTMRAPWRPIAPPNGDRRD